MALQSTHEDARGAAPSTLSADLMFYAGMAIVAVALATALHNHFGASLTVAVAIGAVFLLFNVFVHVVLRRTQARQNLKSFRRASVLNKPASRAAQPPARAESKAAEPSGDHGPAKRHATHIPRKASAEKPAMPPPKQTAPAQAAAPKPVPMRPEPTDEPTASAAQRQDKKDALAVERADRGMDPSKFWTLRPGDPTMGAVPSIGKGAPQSSDSKPAKPERVTTQPVSELSGETAPVEVILKRLADDINAGRTHAGAEAAMPASPQGTLQVPPDDGVTAAPSERLVIDRITETLTPPAAGEKPDTSVAAPTHSATTKPAPRASAPQDRDDNDQPSTSPHLVAALASALAAERVSVFLEPIKSLDSCADQHYEMTLRLNLGDGGSMDREAFSAAASGTAVLPLIDTIALVHARRLVWRKLGTENNGRLFTAVSGETVVDAQFGKDFGRMVAKDNAFPRRIVLSISQADARLFTPAHLAALGQLSASGIVFALDEVTDLDMDFEALAGAGFRFVKLDADVFLNGLPVATTRVPSGDICRHLRGAGLLAIVGHIASDDQLEALKGCGVTLGQGPLFGAADVIKADVAQDN